MKLLWSLSLDSKTKHNILNINKIHIEINKKSTYKSTRTYKWKNTDIAGKYETRAKEVRNGKAKMYVIILITE